MTTPKTAQRIRVAGGDRLERLGRRLTCWIWEHKYRIVQEFHPGRRRIKPARGAYIPCPPSRRHGY
jgi:hypothetical protein